MQVVSYWDVVFSVYTSLQHTLSNRIPRTTENNTVKGHIFVDLGENCLFELTFDTALYRVVRHRQNDRMVGVFFSTKNTSKTMTRTDDVGPVINCVDKNSEL